MHAVARLILAAALVAGARAGHPCDDEHGQFCPEDGPATLGGCLNAQSGLSEGCASWVAMHDACQAELGGYCAKACDEGTCGYSNDAVACLMNWMRQEDVSDECKVGRKATIVELAANRSSSRAPPRFGLVAPPEGGRRRRPSAARWPGGRDTPGWG